MVLTAVAGLLGLLSVAAIALLPEVETLVALLHVGHERNLPAWYNSGLLLLGGVAAAAAAVAARRVGRSRPHVLGWAGLAVLLGVMSLDELAGIHESLGRWLRPRVRAFVADNIGDLDDRGSALVGTTWLIPAFVVLVLLAIAAVWWWRGAAPRVRSWVVLGFGVLVSGAVGMEMVSAVVQDSQAAYLAAMHVEEFLEMTGAALMLIGVLRGFTIGGGHDGPLDDHRPRLGTLRFAG